MAELQHLVPPAALSAASSTPLVKFHDLLETGCKIISCSPVKSKEVSFSQIDPDIIRNYSSNRGQLLGIIRPAWRKVLESETRLDWLERMVKKKLIVRDIEAYAKAQGEMLRSEEMRMKEEERDVLFGLMLIKVKDEKRNLVALRRVREGVKSLLVKVLGKGKSYSKLILDIRRENKKIKVELKNKFDKKLTHLENVRKKIVEEKGEVVPKEIEEYKDCKVFDKGKFEDIKPWETNAVTLNGLELDDDEKEIMKLNPKFAVMRRLSVESQERENEIGFSKLRYEVRKRENNKLENEVEYENTDGKMMKIEKDGEIKERDDDIIDAKLRQVYDPIEKVFDYAKKRTTDLQENGKVYLPKAVNAKIESEIEMIRKIIMDEFVKYKNELDENKEVIRKKVDKDKEMKKRKINQEWSNLSKREKRGLNKLRKRIKNDEIIVLKSDKSGKIIAMEKDKYVKMGENANNKDRKVLRQEVKDIEKAINDHTRMLCKAFNIGENHDHIDRIINSKVVSSEATAPKYFLLKDHKKEEAWRPVVSGCASNTLCYRR